MTREVPMDQPLSDSDREYLHARGLHARVEQLDEMFPAEDVAVEDAGEDAEPRPDWESMTKDQLVAEVARVNREYEVSPPLADAGTKAEVLARLTEWWDKPSE